MYFIIVKKDSEFMIQFTGVNSSQNKIYPNNINNSAVRKYYESQNNLAHPQLQNKKIGLVEGTNIFLGGVLKQTNEMVTSIIEHPLKTATVLAGTTLGFMALPLIGIPSAVGGGVLAIGFAGLAITKAVNHAIKFTKTNKEGSLDMAKLHLQQLGEDFVDVALSVPFVPKGITNIKNFVKYGKFGINKSLINELKTTNKLSDKFKIIAKADKEILRSNNFQGAVDKEIATLTNLTDVQKAQIKKELLEFNVATEKIPELVMEKYAQAKGISTKPDLKYVTMAHNVKGSAIANYCSIYLNDYKPYFGKPVFDEFKVLNHNQVGNEYVITYINKNTGTTIVENIDVNIYDSYIKLCQLYKKLSPEAARILTLVHEREHIHQFAQLSKMKGFDWLKGNINERGKELYEKMFKEIPTVKMGSPEAITIESYANRAQNGTLAAYIKQPLEIGARNIEIQALNHPTFEPLNNVFKTMTTSNKQSCVQNIMINDIRIESSKV